MVMTRRFCSSLKPPKTDLLKRYRRQVLSISHPPHFVDSRTSTYLLGPLFDRLVGCDTWLICFRARDLPKYRGGDLPIQLLENNYKWLFYMLYIVSKVQLLCRFTSPMRCLFLFSSPLQVGMHQSQSHISRSSLLSNVSGLPAYNDKCVTSGLILIGHSESESKRYGK